ncbi:acetylornithine deacetylase [Chelativorans xinjiangense]|uniref:acetylornithine deacetylase n=1 Tax=Chelativorans xinjiangense TaxID=2681485 RepID=UPI0019162A7C|nr:acetylornithine deacetylase [Chelativorans xinjiangense]
MKAAEAPSEPSGNSVNVQGGKRDSCKPSETAVAWIKRLVAFDTTSHKSNLDLIEDVKATLALLGFVFRITYDTTGRKANLLATLPSGDGRLTGGLCLSGHVDAVPVDGQPWSSSPFLPVIHDSRIYGRGTCDMKGFVGTAIAVAVAHHDKPRQAPLHLALSYDEEVGCLGAPAMVQDMIASGIVPDGCVVGEPTMMKVVSAHKGANVGRCRVEGLARHSSLAPQGINAIEFASRIIVHMQSMADEFARSGPFSDGFDVPFTTLQVGQIEGGIAVNTVPASCTFTFELRNLPSTSADAVFDRIREYARTEVLPPMRHRADGAADIVFERLAAAPALEPQEDSAFTRLVRAVTGDTAIRKVAYGTEAGIFSQAGIPTVVCGPGDIAQAHTADEYVELSQIARCEAVLSELAKRMCVRASEPLSSKETAS